MSKILNRPMFRGGGKVSSYGNGIATGLADGGMPDKRGLVDGPGGYAGEYRFGETGLGKTLGGIGAIRPAFYDIFNTIANKGSEFLTGYNPGLSYNKQLRSERDLKDKMMGNDPLKRSDRMTDEEVDYTNFLFMKPNAETGFTTSSMQEEKPEIVEENKISAAELALMEKNKSLTDQLNSFLNPKNKKNTKEEAVAAIKERQEVMEEVMGGGKSARIADASDMALNFASKALGEEATVKSSFADFFADESKRPSRSQKVKDAAANAAIQSYLTEQLSEKDFNKQMRMIMGKQEILNKSNNPENMDWNKRRSYYQAIGKDRNRDVDSVLKSSLQDEPGNNQVIFTEKTDFIKDPTLASEMEDGFYVVTTKNGKRVFQIIEGILTDRSSDFPI